MCQINLYARMQDVWLRRFRITTFCNWYLVYFTIFNLYVFFQDLDSRCLSLIWLYKYNCVIFLIFLIG